MQYIALFILCLTTTSNNCFGLPEIILVSMFGSGVFCFGCYRCGECMCPEAKEKCHSTCVTTCERKDITCTCMVKELFDKTNVKAYITQQPLPTETPGLKLLTEEEEESDTHSVIVYPDSES